MLMWIENREFGQETDGYTPESVITANIEAMVKRSRNHPSIILWSLCNEGGCIQRSPEQAIRKGNAALEAIHALDTTRPMTAAINFGAGGKQCEWDCLSPTLEVVGMNYVSCAIYPSIPPSAKSSADCIDHGSNITRYPSTGTVELRRRWSGGLCSWNISDRSCGWHGIDRTGRIGMRFTRTTRTSRWSLAR